MALLQNSITTINSPGAVTASQKRRIRRKRLQKVKNLQASSDSQEISPQDLPDLITNNKTQKKPCGADTSISKPDLGDEKQHSSLETISKIPDKGVDMSSKESEKSREEIKAAREAKKLAKQKAKNKGGNNIDNVEINNEKASKDNFAKDQKQGLKEGTKCVDEVDRAAVAVSKESDVLKNVVANESLKAKELVLTERAAKKAAKQAKKKGADGDIAPKPDMTVKDVVETLKDIKNVAKDVQDLTAKVSAIHFEAMKHPASRIESKPSQRDETSKQKSDEGKSKAELRAERRAKQEAQRAAKQAADDQKASQIKVEAIKAKPEVVKPDSNLGKEKSPKPKSEKVTRPASACANRVNWFQHLYPQHDKEALKNIALNSNLHPAIIKLGVQLASRVISGSNARCIALLDALKKMVKDYTLPAKTEFSRGLEAALASSLEFLWAMRQPAAAQVNAVKYFRHHLNQLPNNIDEFDAKKILQQEIDHYIEDQIDKAGEAISMTVQKKISTGDNILTYGCSSLIERCLREAWEAGLKFRTVVVGDRVSAAGHEMLRRLTAAGLPCTYVDMTAICFIMKSVNKVLLGAGSLLVNGSVLGAAGTAQVALVAREHNVPVLVACETHKFSERVQTDAFVYNELGDPDALIDKSDENSPLKDWRSIPNLTPLNLTYDVTPASLVTAVVTEKAILPCTSAPVVLRTKLTEYGM